MKGLKLGIITLTVIFAGCATIVKNPLQNLDVKTNPPGLIAKIGDKQCITPCTFEGISRKTEYVDIDVYGNESKHKIDISFNAGLSIFGNFWNLVMPGLIVDLNSGASRELLPTEINFRFSTYATWAQKLSKVGTAINTLEDVSLLLGSPPIKCEVIDPNSIMDIDAAKRPKEVKQCYWDITAGNIAQNKGEAFVNNYGGSANHSSSQYNRFFRASCRAYDGRAIGCQSNWQD